MEEKYLPCFERKEETHLQCLERKMEEKYLPCLERLGQALFLGLERQLETDFLYNIFKEIPAPILINSILEETPISRMMKKTCIEIPASILINSIFVERPILTVTGFVGGKRPVSTVIGILKNMPPQRLIDIILKGILASTLMNEASEKLQKNLELRMLRVIGSVEYARDCQFFQDDKSNKHRASIWRLRPSIHFAIHCNLGKASVKNAEPSSSDGNEDMVNENKPVLSDGCEEWDPDFESDREPEMWNSMTWEYVTHESVPRSPQRSVIISNTKESVITERKERQTKRRRKVDHSGKFCGRGTKSRRKITHTRKLLNIAKKLLIIKDLQEENTCLKMQEAKIDASTRLLVKEYQDRKEFIRSLFRSQQVGVAY